MNGCLMCGAVVEFPDFTLLCNGCEMRNLEWADADNAQRWAIMAEEFDAAFFHEFEQITRVMRDNIFDGLVFNQPRYRA